MANKPGRTVHYSVHHLDTPITWGETVTAPIVWRDDIPEIDPDYLKERGWK